MAACRQSGSIAAMSTKPDLIRTRLVWNRLLAIVEEQAQTLTRTVLVVTADFAATVNAQGHLILGRRRTGAKALGDGGQRTIG